MPLRSATTAQAEGVCAIEALPFDGNAGRVNCAVVVVEGEVCCSASEAMQHTLEDSGYCADGRSEQETQAG